MTTELKKYTDYDYEKAIEAKDYSGVPTSQIKPKIHKSHTNDIISPNSIRAMEQLKQRCDMIESELIKQKCLNNDLKVKLDDAQAEAEGR